MPVTDKTLGDALAAVIAEAIESNYDRNTTTSQIAAQAIAERLEKGYYTRAEYKDDSDRIVWESDYTLEQFAKLATRRRKPYEAVYRLDLEEKP